MTSTTTMRMSDNCRRLGAASAAWHASSSSRGNTHNILDSEDDSEDEEVVRLQQQANRRPPAGSLYGGSVETGCMDDAEARIARDYEKAQPGGKDDGDTEQPGGRRNKVKPFSVVTAEVARAAEVWVPRIPAEFPKRLEASSHSLLAVRQRRRLQQEQQENTFNKRQKTTHGDTNTAHHNKNNNTTSNKSFVAAAAAYSRNLLACYETNVCREVLPQCHWLDALRQLEGMGSRPTVKTALTTVRHQQHRNPILYKLLGHATVQRLLMMQSEHTNTNEATTKPPIVPERNDAPTNSAHWNPTTNDGARIDSGGDDIVVAAAAEEEQEATFDDDNDDVSQQDNNNDDSHPAIMEATTATNNNANDDDNDDAQMEEVEQRPTLFDQPAAAAAHKKRFVARRAILDDDDDDELDVVASVDLAAEDSARDPSSNIIPTTDSTGVSPITPPATAALGAVDAALPTKQHSSVDPSSNAAVEGAPLAHEALLERG